MLRLATDISPHKIRVLSQLRNIQYLSQWIITINILVVTMLETIIRMEM